MFQYFTDKIEWSILHYEINKNVYIIINVSFISPNVCLRATDLQLAFIRRSALSSPAVTVSVDIAVPGSQNQSSFISQSDTERYKFAELSDMNLTYRKAQGHGREAKTIYQERYLQRQLPHRTKSHRSTGYCKSKFTGDEQGHYGTSQDFSNTKTGRGGVD